MRDKPKNKTIARNKAARHAYFIDETLEAGIVLFRNSALQLELGVTWDALWDEFNGFGRRFGSGTVYLAVNY